MNAACFSVGEGPPIILPTFTKYQVCLWECKSCQAHQQHAETSVVYDVYPGPSIYCVVQPLEHKLDGVACWS